MFLYAEYQVSVPFTELDWPRINASMQRFAGLRSKTWLSGVNTHSIGDFYEFDSLERAQAYVDEVLQPYAARIQGNLSVKLFDGEVVEAASRGMNSPFFPAG